MSIIERLIKKQAGGLQGRPSLASTPVVDEPSATGRAVVAETGRVGETVIGDFQTIDLGPWCRLHGMVAEDPDRNALVEHYRRIKRPLIFNVEGDGRLSGRFRNRIMVTSSFPDEGKTFNSLNLSISMAAERERKVVLIDADMKQSSIQEILEVEDRIGLIDYLDGSLSSIGDIVHRTSIDNLMVIPSGGEGHAYSAELIAGKAMNELLEEVELVYPEAIVVLDTPPLMVSSESVALMRLVGQVVVVVGSGQVNQRDLLSTLSMIDETKLAGLVLNKVREGRQVSYDYVTY